MSHGKLTSLLEKGQKLHFLLFNFFLHQERSQIFLAMGLRKKRPKNLIPKDFLKSFLCIQFWSPLNPPNYLPFSQYILNVEFFVSPKWKRFYYFA